MVKLVHENLGKIEDYIPSLNMDFVFKSGNHIETEGTGYIYGVLGKDCVGIVDENITSAPHLIINVDNLDYATYSEIEYEEEYEEE